MSDPSLLSRIKPGDRARMCVHLEVVAKSQIEYALEPTGKAFIPWPDTHIELTPRGYWAFACDECAAAAKGQGISLDEQISISKRVS